MANRAIMAPLIEGVSVMRRVNKSNFVLALAFAFTGGLPAALPADAASVNSLALKATYEVTANFSWATRAVSVHTTAHLMNPTGGSVSTVAFNLGTLHTGNASRTLDRLLDVFPVDQQDQIRVMVSESLRGVISQQLVPRIEGKSRILALEILTNTPAVANVIREAKTFMLPGIIQTGRKQGMRLMDDSLSQLFDQGLISAQEACSRAEQKQAMRQHVAAVNGG